MNVRLTPGTADAGGTRIFEVVDARYNTANRQLTLTGRDGKICLELVGLWELRVKTSLRRAMGVDEIERIHEGRTLVRL